MTNKFRITVTLMALLVSAALVFFSSRLFFDISKLQNSLQRINTLSVNDDQDQVNVYQTSTQFDSSAFDLLSWDSEVSYTLALADLYVLKLLESNSPVQIGLSKVQVFLNRAQHFTPLNINSIVANLSILIEQGAPLDYLLPKIDKLIELVPKDQDLKAEIAKLCFQLSVVNNDSNSQSKIIDRLNKLFVYSMDYRGMIQVNRYSRMFNQDELLSKVKMNVQN